MYAYVVCNKDIDYENLESLKDNMFNKKIDVPSQSVSYVVSKGLR